MILKEAFVDFQQHVRGGHKVLAVGGADDFQNIDIQRFIFSEVEDIEMPMLKSSFLNGLIKKELHISVPAIMRNSRNQAAHIFRFTFNEFHESTLMVEDHTGEISILIVTFRRFHDARQIGRDGFAVSGVFTREDNQMDLRRWIYHEVLP